MVRAMGLEASFNKPKEVEPASLERPDSAPFDADKLKSSEIEKPALDPIESRLSDPAEVARPIEGLEHTLQKIEVQEDGSTVYNTPFTTGRKLNHDQGRAVENVQGTCVIVSAENLCRMAGKNLTEADVIKTATELELCETGNADSAENGGMYSKDIPQLLGALGIKASEFRPTSHEDVASAIESGRGVIAVVNTMRFWEDCPIEGLHAVTLTSVERGPDGEVRAFYVCDSGTGGEDYARRIDADLLADSAVWHSPFVATDSPIR